MKSAKCYWLVGIISLAYAYFIPNKGQWRDERILFQAQKDNLTITIFPKGVRFSLKRVISENEFLMASQPHEVEFHHIYLYPLQGNLENIHLEEPSSWYHNYIYPWKRAYQVHGYKQISVKGLYPNIDWILYSDENGFKTTFVVHPGGDVNQITLVYHSKMPPMIDNGDLVFTTPLGIFREKAPVTIQNQRIIPSKYLIEKIAPLYDGFATYVKIKVGSYNTNEPLIIDPPLWWATFWGGSEIDGPMSSTLLSNGDLVMGGYTESADAPLANPGNGAYFQSTLPCGLRGCDALFLWRFNSQGALIWATFFGGSWLEPSNAFVTADDNDNIYFVGSTISPDFPIQSWGGAYNDSILDSCGPTCGVCYIMNGDDRCMGAFIARFNSAGQLTWSTFIDGAGSEQAFSAATDANGNVYVVGMTSSLDFPIVGGSSCNTTNNNNSERYDIFVVKFNSSGQLIWSTCIGGRWWDGAFSISVSPVDQSIYIVGWSDSDDFPIYDPGNGAFIQFTHGGGYFDLVLIKFDSSGNLIWSTYYGGSGNEPTTYPTVHPVAGYGGFPSASSLVDNNGNFYVLFSTASSDLNTVTPPGFYTENYNGGMEVFLLKFNNSLQLEWATYLGGRYNDIVTTADNLAVDQCGNLYVTFVTHSDDMNTLAPCDASGFFDPARQDSVDLFLMTFDPNGTLLWSTYIGGNGFDLRNVIAIAPNNHIYLTGEWGSVSDDPANVTGYPLANPGGGAYFDPSYNGADDAFVLKFLDAPCMCSVLSANTIQLKAKYEPTTQQTILQWQNTFTNLQGNHYLQRSSNLKQWQTLYQTHQKTATYIDHLSNKDAKQYYYRVKFVTPTGETHFSNIAFIEIPQKVWQYEIQNQQLTIHSYTPSPITIYDALGRKIFHTTLSQEQPSITLSLQKGVYLIYHHATHEAKRVFIF